MSKVKVSLLMIVMMFVFVGCNNSNDNTKNYLKVEITNIMYNSVEFDIIGDDNHSMEFVYFELYSTDDEELIMTSELEKKKVYSLKSGHHYEIRVYSKSKDEENAQVGMETAEFTTAVKRLPTAEINRVYVYGNMIEYDLKILDFDDVGYLDSMAVLKDGEVYDSTKYGNGFYVDFDSEYIVRMIYKYDLNDGNGEQSIIDEKIVSIPDEITNYFIDIALGFEFGSSSLVTRKWEDDMKIYIDGLPSTELLEELDSLIIELNSYFTDGFQITITESKEDANFFLFFGSGPDFSEKYNVNLSYTETNIGLFFMKYNAHNFLISGKSYVNTVDVDLYTQKHILREELTQSLGLARDSNIYEDSVFFQYSNEVVEFSDLDIKLIKLLYSPNMKTGLDKEDILELLPSIMEAVLGE